MTEATIDPAPEATERYHKRVSVAASPATVFALLTDPDRLRRWQSVVSAVDLTVDGDFRHLVVPGAVARGRFTEIEPDRRLVYTWGWEDEQGVPPGSSRVTVELVPDGDRTIIDFTHDGLPDAEAVANHAHGWDHFLDRLAVAAESGDAGPNPWASGPEELDLLGAAEASLAVTLDLLRATDDRDLSRPTPCAAFTVGDLVEHLTRTLSTLGGIARATAEPIDEAAPAEARVAAVAGSALAAWRDRGVDGEVEFGDSVVPATMALSVVVAELYVHGWDLARATGHPFEPADQVTATADAATRGVVPAERGDRFGPPQPEDGLGPVESLIAFTGRTV